MALAAVAQALNTLVNVMPVSPTRRVTASGLDTSWLPPKPNWMSFHPTPAPVNAGWIASAPICIAVFSNLPNGCRPTPMMATSLVISGSSWVDGGDPVHPAPPRSRSPLDRLESERDDLVAVSVGGERHHGELDLLTELELGRVVLGQPALDSDHVTELDQADAERDEVVTGRAKVGSSGREALGGPCHQGSAARQQQLAHPTATAARTPLLHWEGGGATVAASTADQLRAVIGPGGDVGGKCFLHRVILQRSSVQRPEYCSLNRITAFRKVEIPFSQRTYDSPAL